MQFVSCFQFIFLIGNYNVIKILSASEYTIQLTRDDRRLTNAWANETAGFKITEDHDTHVSILGIGSPEQSNFNLQFSLGTHISWIFSERYGVCDLDYERVRRLHSRYNLNASHSYHYPTKTAAAFIRIREDWALGYRSKDTLVIPVYGRVSHEYIEVSKASTLFTNGKVDGVISLRYNPTEYSENFATKICGPNAQFSFYFPRKKKDIPDSSTGQLLLCGIDESKFTGSMIYMEDRHPGQWRIFGESVGVVLNNNQFKPITEYLDVSFDSAIDRIGGPTVHVNNIFNWLNVSPIPNYSDRKKIECNQRDQAPVIKFLIGGIRWTLNAYDYTRKVEYPDGNTYCEVLIKPIEDDLWILGDIFLRVVYTVFDITGRRVGFSEAK